MSLFSNILSNPRNKKLTIIILFMAAGIASAPRDPAILTSPAGVYILPAMISGICFGIVMIMLLDVVRGFGDKAKSSDVEV